MPNGIDVSNNNGSVNWNNVYGAGIRFAITPHFHLMADVRAGTRSTVSNDSPTGLSNGVARTVAPPTSTSNENEDYTRVRLTAMLYF